MILSSIKEHPVLRHKKILIITALTLVAYYIALNREQAFPWLIASLLLSSLIASYFFPRLLIRNVSVSRTGPDRAKENEHIFFDIKISNHGIIPRFMIQAIDKLPFIHSLEGIKSNTQILGVVAYIGSGATHNFKVSVGCEKRGLYQLGPVGISTSFPFGLLEAHQNKNGGTQTLRIYPDLFPIVRLPLLGTPSEIHRGGFLLPKGAGSAEFSGLREYRQGDNPRHIHWPTTARTNELMLKEFEPLASANLHIILDQSKVSNVGTGKHSSFEYAVRIAASIARYAIDNGMSINVSPYQGKDSIGLGSGEMHFREIMDYLAIIDANSDVTYSTVIQEVAISMTEGQTAIVFLSEPSARVSETLQSLALLKARGANIIAIHLDRASFMGTHSESHSLWTGIFDLGIGYFSIRKDDNLTSAFNS